jgi:hypothetical protein|tara:strand:- start:529 stop:786 length:258 start_codon:yes stop_codon:yes gene_type:complete
VFSNKLTGPCVFTPVKYFRPYALSLASSLVYWNTNTAINPDAPSTHNDLLSHFAPLPARSPPETAANTTGADDCFMAHRRTRGVR